MVSFWTLASSACGGVHVSGSGHILTRGVFLHPHSSHRHEVEDQSAQDEGGSGVARCVFGTLEPTAFEPSCLISLYSCCHCLFNSLFPDVYLYLLYIYFFFACFFLLTLNVFIYLFAFAFFIILTFI